MSIKNGDGIDSLFKKEEELPKTKLEKLYNNLLKINPTAMMDISKYSKMLMENKKENLIVINKSMAKRLELINEILSRYNKTILSIKGVNLNSIQVQQLKTVFSKLYNILDVEKNKLLFLKSFEIVEENGVKSILLNQNSLDNIEREFGIKNPYKDVQNIEEEIKKLEETNDTSENLKTQKDLNLKDLELNENNRFNLTQIDQGGKKLKKEIKDIEINIEKTSEKINKLKEQKEQMIIDFNKSSLKSILNIFNLSNSTLGIKITKSLPQNFKDELFNKYEIKEKTLTLKDILGSMETFSKELEGNTSKLQQSLQRTVTKDVEVKIEFDDPKFRGLRPTM